LFGTIVGVGVPLFFGCSSDRPAASGATTTGPDALSPVEGSVLIDAGGDQDIGDAATDPFSDDGHCLDDQPAPTIDGGFTGGDDAGIPICPTTGTCVTYCNDVVAHYKLGVAQVAVTCMRKLPDCSTVLDVRLCVQNALMAACRDTTAPGACAPLVLPCDPNAGGMGSLIDQNGCEAYMKGLNPTGRGALAACIKDKIEAGTCASEVVQCTDQIQL
jgi:hypothetical protein